MHIGYKRPSILHTIYSTMSLRSCCVKSSAITSQRCVTVLFDSWRALIDDNISVFFFFSKGFKNKESAVSMKASFIIFPSSKDLMIDWLTHNNASGTAFACESRRVKNNCCTINCDLSSLTFLFLSSLFGGKSIWYFLWTVWKCLSTFPFFRIAKVVWQIRQMHFKKTVKKSPPPILHGSGMFWVVLLGPAIPLNF